MSDQQLLEIHIDALFTHDADGRIRRVNEPDGDPAPRFFFGRTRQGNLWRIRHDVPDDIVRRLDELAADEPVRDDLRAEQRNLEAFMEAFGVDGEARVVNVGPAYRFPDELPIPTNVTPITHENVHLMSRMAPYLDDVLEQFDERQPRMVVVEDGAAVSICNSARLTEHAAEAGVETLETYRGRGHAPAVVAAWAHAIRATGRIPLYSTSWNNLASQAVARKLGLIQYATDLSLE